MDKVNLPTAIVLLGAFGLLAAGVATGHVTLPASMVGAIVAGALAVMDRMLGKGPQS